MILRIEFRAAKSIAGMSTLFHYGKNLQHISVVDIQIYHSNKSRFNTKTGGCIFDRESYRCKFTDAKHYIETGAYRRRAEPVFQRLASSRPNRKVHSDAFVEANDASDNTVVARTRFRPANNGEIRCYSFIIQAWSERISIDTTTMLPSVVAAVLVDFPLQISNKPPTSDQHDDTPEISNKE
ncbi:hypothetical protein M422DRAFT_249716 [Sphaerobolus stellatus SS14]|uniref:Uncharacterized protein n=1 Tax=Sphaerobolus stellatus (strain SS14) TaxID=990650 RepID=A0A0C9VH51_SPHS4|nr:hypothetical protein M422DRAFT_249716 [Sphaerobolus stellatus SS14]